MSANATTVNASTADNDATVELLTNLIPALMKTFLVILAGFVFGTTNLYPKENAGAIGRLCGTLLLPVAMFNAMATLIVTEEAWTFLYAVAICKGGIFFIVLGIMLCVDRLPGRIGRAAIWSVFSTQSNDFALGLPIFNVLYGTSNPGYIYFLYIVAPVNLVVLNPIAFVLMEFSRAKEGGKKFDCKAVGMVLKQVFTNPLVLLTFAGLILRLALWEPASDQSWYADYVEPVLSVVSDAFTGCALFSLGLLIVGKFALLKKNSPLKPILFILVKSLVLPILLKLVLDLLAPGDSDLSTAGFLYGIIPTAAGVFTYCMQFGMNPDTIAISMVLGTIASAPLMLSLGSMVAIASDASFNILSFAAAVPYFKMIPAAFSIIGTLLFFIGSLVHWRRQPPDARVFRVCMMTAAFMLVLCYVCLYPCQILLAPIAAAGNHTVEELHSAGAKALFIINFFSLTFYRGMVAAVSVLTCFVLKRRIETQRELSPAEQNAYIWKVHLSVLGFVTAATIFVVAYTGIETDSCVSPFSIVMSATTCAIQFCFAAVSIVGLVWYNRLRHRLHAMPEFADDFALTLTNDAGDGGLGGSGAAVTALRDMSIASPHNDKTKLLDAQDALADGAGVADLDDVDIADGDGDTYGNGDSDDGDEGSGGGDRAAATEITKTHPSSRYLDARFYGRRFSIVVYETCVCVLGTIVLFISVIDNAILTSDPILFAVSFLLALLTYSSGIVLSVALAMPLLDCRRRPSAKSMQVNFLLPVDGNQEAHFDF